MIDEPVVISGMPFWNAMRDRVHRSLAAPRTNLAISATDPGIDIEWWRTARARYRSGLFFCPPLTDALTGRLENFNSRAAKLTQARKLEPFYIPNKQTLKTAIAAEEGVSLQFLMKVNLALEAIVAHDTVDTVDYQTALDGMAGLSIIPSFHIVNWQVLEELQSELRFSKLDDFSEAIFKDEPHISGQKKRAVLSQLKQGYAMKEAGNGQLSVTKAFADSAVKGVTAIKNTPKVTQLFELKPNYHTRALSASLGNIVAAA